MNFTEPLESCCCPVQKYLPRIAELAWQLSKYLWRGSVNFKINSRLFTIIYKLINDDFKTRDFSPFIETVLSLKKKNWFNQCKPTQSNILFLKILRGTYHRSWIERLWHVLYASSMCIFIIFYYVCHFGALTKKSLKCAALNAAAVLTDCMYYYILCNCVSCVMDANIVESAH